MHHKKKLTDKTHNIFYVLVLLNMSDTEENSIKSDDEIEDVAETGAEDEKNTIETLDEDGVAAVDEITSEKEDTVSEAESTNEAESSDNEKSESDKEPEAEKSEEEDNQDNIDYEEQQESKDEKCFQKYAKKAPYDIEDKNLVIEANKWNSFTIVKKKDRITGKQMTKYEYCRIVGVRAAQIEKGAPPLIEVPKHITNYDDIAKLELVHKLCPFIVRRPLPNNLLEEWEIEELDIWQGDLEILELLKT